MTCWLAEGTKPRPEVPAPVVGICRTHLWSTAQPETVAALERVTNSVTKAGGRVTEIALPGLFADLTAARARINAYERARALAYEWHQHRQLISERLQKTMGDGFVTSPEDYWAAQTHAARCRALLPDVIKGVDVLLTPCVPGEAPRGLEHTGEPRFQELWTALHAPSISVPAGKGPKGLPVAVQLVAAPGQDDKLLAVARWVSKLI